MALLTETTRKLALFVLGPRRRSDGPEQWVPIGTAFVVAIPAETVTGAWWVYAVTARHVVENERETALRMRRVGGEAEVLPVPQWVCHPTQDVAVAQLVLDDWMDFIPWPLETQSIDRYDGPHEWGLGEKVYFVGLLADIPEMVSRDIPMVRSGTTGALYQERVPIELYGRVKSHITAHLIDCQSFAGFSGSPCFIYFEERIVTGAQVTLRDRVFLLGLMSGHFDKWRKPRVNEESLATDAGDFEADYVGPIEVPVNSGVGLCTPVEYIRETIYLEEQVEDPKEKEVAAQQEPVEPSNPATADRLEGEDQDFTREKFLTDLGRASRRTDEKPPKETE